MPWYENGLRFECTQCGRCCIGEPGYVWVTDEEIARLATRLGYSVPQFEDSFVRVVRGRMKSLIEFENGDCVLYDDETKGCRVYEERPIQCKTWPFWDRNIDTENSWKKVARFCKGCNRGRLYTLEEIERAKAGIETLNR